MTIGPIAKFDLQDAFCLNIEKYSSGWKFYNEDISGLITIREIETDNSEMFILNRGTFLEQG